MSPNAPRPQPRVQSVSAPISAKRPLSKPNSLASRAPRKVVPGPTKTLAKPPVKAPARTPIKPSKAPSRTSAKAPYPFGGESPFIKSVQVEKRPLSNSGTFTRDNHLQSSGKSSYAGNKTTTKNPRKKSKKAEKKGNTLSFIAIIAITIILGAVTGIGVYLAIAG